MTAPIRRSNKVMHKMSTGNDSVTTVADGDAEEKPKSRKIRKAYQAMARRNKETLVEVSRWAVAMHNGDKELAMRWMYQKNVALDNDTPLELVLMGKGDAVLDYCKKNTQIDPQASC